MGVIFQPYQSKAKRLYSLAEKRTRLQFIVNQKFYEDSLYEFVKAAWSSIDSSEFRDSWALQAFCDHLECVTFGLAPRLLGNYPPRCAKTTIASICWPAWTWIQREISFTSGPQVRFLCASYNEKLAFLNANKCRRLVLSPFYQKYWGDNFQLTTDQNNKTQFDNTKGGSRIATSVGGSLLGLGGDVICFPHDETVQTENGPMAIGDLVDGRAPVRVWSYNKITDRCELKPVIGWHRNPGRRLVKVTIADGSHVTCTTDHKLMTQRGYVEASRLGPSDFLLSAPRGVFVAPLDVIAEPSRCDVPPCSAATDAGNCAERHAVPDRKNSRGIMAFANLANGHFGQNASSFFLRKIKFWEKTTGPDICNRSFADAIPTRQCLGGILANRDGSRHVGGQSNLSASLECSVASRIFNVLRPSPVFDVVERWVRAVSVFVSDLLSIGARADEGLCNHLMAEQVVSFAGPSHGDARVSFVEDRRKHLRFERVAPVVSLPFDTTYSSDVRNLVETDKSNYRKPSLMPVVRVDFVHDVPASTFCLTVADNHNMLVGQGISCIVGKNCIDDPHNTETEKVVETDAERTKVESWFKEVRSTRLNDPKQTAIVVVMQRLHERDLSGVILDSDDEEWTHLMIPMEFDERRKISTIVLPQYDYEDDDKNPVEPWPWSDPRTKEGELMWPERFGHKEVDRMKGIMGPYMASGRLQQAPVPKGGGIIQKDWWMLWDQQEAMRYGLEWHGGRKEFPPFELVVGSIDTSYGLKQENDFNAMTVWGIWLDRNRNRRAMLMYAWAKRLKLTGMVIAQNPNEAKVNYLARQKEEWGLIEWVADTCKRYRVRRLLIENKTRGVDVANEINRLYARDNWGVELLEPQGDKVSRTHGIVPMFTDGAIWAPNTGWAQIVIDQSASFPKGAHDDIHDTVTQFLNWAREHGIIMRADEMTSALEDEMRPKPHDGGVAGQYGVG